MKRFLTFILAIAMIATLIPSAFAVETDGEGENYDGVKITYDIENLMVGFNMMGSTSTIPFSTLSYANTNGLFKYVRSIATDPDTTPFNQIGNETQMSSSSTGTIYYPGVATTQAFMVLRKGAYVSFEIVVPRDGEYTLELHHQKGTNGATGDVYISSASAFYSLSKFALASLGEKLNSFSCKDTTGNVGSISNTNWTNTEIFTKRVLTAGKYVITYYTSADRVAFGNFTLSSGTNPREITDGGYSIKYDIKNAMIDNGVHHNYGVSASVMDYNATNNFFEIAYCPSDISYASMPGTTYNFMKLKENSYITFKVNVPEKGTYSLKTAYQRVKDGTKAEIYIDGSETKCGEYDCYDATAASKMGANVTLWSDEEIVAENLELEAGEHTITIKALAGNTTDNDFASVSNFELISGPLGTLTTDMGASIKVSGTTLTVGEAADVEYAKAYLSDGSVDESKVASGVYKSSDDKVVTVSGTTITAVGAGTADITTTVGGVEAKRTITVLNKAVSGDVSFGVYSDVANSVTVTVDDEASDVIVDSVAVGSWIRATAKTDDPNYIFRGWKRGSADNGVWISENTEIYFPIMTNTFLTAVYETVVEEEDIVNVEFYNYNGQYLNTAKDVGTKTFAEIKPEEEPSLTGYTMPFWTVDGENEVANDTTFKKLTRIVANYRNKDSFSIEIDEGISGKIAGTETDVANGKYEYDTVFIFTAAEEGTWYVDGKPVAYGDKYAHNVWNDASITFDTAENTAPIITLDGETKENGARMISYDANGANIAEVGIIFGKDAKITSFDSKAAAKKRGNSQGQFTAMPYDGDGKDARGYLIYNDKGTYRVIYAD